MKTIELTKKQKERLLEMCVLYFPEREWSYPNYDGLIGTFIPGIDEDDPQETTINDNLDIHWFEFLIFHLIPKLVKYKTKQGVYDYDTHSLNHICTMDKNPIDSLYFYYKNNYIK